MKIFLSMFLLFILIPKQITPLSNNYKNGNWWNNLNDEEKFDYLNGFIDGMDLGVYFSYLTLKKNNTHNEIVKQIIISYNSNKKKYFNDVTFRKIIDQMNILYSDPKNINFKIRVALYIVLLKIANVSQSEIDQILSHFDNLKD